VDLDRNAIERRDFPAARRGYDPDEVDRHLREIADAVTQLKRQPRPAQSTGSVASQAAEQVRAIVEAAETSAAEIERRADEEARRITSEAEQAARDTRALADAEAAEHVRRAEEKTRAILERAAAIDEGVDELLSGVRSTAGELVSRLRETADRLVEEVRSASGGLTSDVRERASALTGELEAMRTELEAMGASAPRPEAAAVAEAEPEAEPEPEPELEIVEQEPIPGTTALDESAEDVAAEEEVEPADETVEVEAPAADPNATVAGGEGARLIALNMALNGTPREETARYLSENFDLDDADAVLDDVYSRIGQ
jgi:DivIVA domain-containing protein